MPYVPNELLGRLVGLELGSVAFVRDYVQLDFNGPILTCDVWPRVESRGVTWGIDDQGYRDRLCSLIGASVLSTYEETGAGLRIDFDAGSVVVHPSSEELMGPEIAMLSGFDDRAWMVWRPGEDSFEDLV